MPAAAVIPASVAYIKVVAVKKLVVAFLARGIGPTFIVGTRFSLAILEWSVLAFSCRSVSRSSAHAEGHGRRRGDADAGVGWVKCRAEPGAAVCAPAPNFELLCVVYCMASI